MSEDKVEVTFWIVMNEDGEYIVSHDEDNMGEMFDDEVGGLVRDVTKITVRKSKPKTIELGPVDLPDDGSEFKLSID